MQIVFQPEELWRAKAKENTKPSQIFFCMFFLFFFLSFYIYCDPSLEHHQDAEEKRNDNKT